MSDDVSKVLGEAIDAFLETVPPTIRYYAMGGDVEIPTAAELALLHVFETSPPRSRADLTDIASKLTMDQAYTLPAFSLRMAIYAVRTNAIQALRAGTFGLVIDNDLKDWRDVLLSLSIVEDCASRLGTDLHSVMQNAIKVATDQRRDTINAYISRPPDWRGLGIMRVEAFGDGPTLRYKHHPL